MIRLSDDISGKRTVTEVCLPQALPGDGGSSDVWRALMFGGGGGGALMFGGGGG